MQFRPRPRALAAAFAASALVAALVAGPASGRPHHAKGTKPVHGGYYPGRTAPGKRATADVSPDGSQVSAASFELDCGGQDTVASLQSMPITKTHGKYKFSGSGQEALLFTASSLSELGTVTVNGRFVAHHKVKGTFRVVSPTCGDSGAIKFTLKLEKKAVPMRIHARATVRSGTG